MKDVQPYKYEGPTRADAVKKLEGWPEAAQQIALARSAPERHAARVEATKRAALHWVRFAGVAETEKQQRDDYTEACLLLILDLAEVWGTRRLRYAQELGAGRWKAADGEAWKAAAKQALHELLSDADQEAITLWTGGTAWKLTARGVLKLGVDMLWDDHAIVGAWGDQEHLYRYVHSRLSEALDSDALGEARLWDYVLRVLVSWDEPTERGSKWLDHWMPTWRQWVGLKLTTESAELEKVARGDSLETA